MKTTEDIKVAQYWNNVAKDFDAIYTGENKSAFARDRSTNGCVGTSTSDSTGSCGSPAISRARRSATLAAGRGGSWRAWRSMARTRVMGVDVAPEMLKLARDLAKKEGVAGRTDFAQMDIIDWNRSDVFDETIAIGLWDYFPDPT